MRRNAIFLLIVVCSFVLGGLAQTNNPIIGKWACKSVDEKGMEASWTMLVKEDQGKLTGYIEGAEPGADQIPLVEPTLEGSTFTFKVVINPEEIVTISGKVAGDKFAGKFTGKASGTGSFSGKKQA